MNKVLINRDIIIIGQQPWDTEIGSNCKNIALELCKNNRVLYLNSPLDRITKHRNLHDPKVIKRVNVIKQKESGLILVQDKLWNYYPDCLVESINWINNHSIFNFFNKINNQRFAKSIEKAIKLLAFKDIILFNDNEMFKGFYLQDLLKPSLSIYYSRDYMLGVAYWRKHGLKLEPQLIAKNDICFSNSAYLAEFCRKYNQNSFNVGQGCDVDDFINVTDDIPKDIPSSKEKIIGYVGALDSGRLAINVINSIALAYPNNPLLLIGPEDEQFRASNLHNLSNVFFLGSKPVHTLPNYINAIDVCINPQILNEITIGNYPRKIDEYLALGKPVVATATKTMEFFKDHVYLADNENDYVSLINRALNEDDSNLKDNRIKFALTHTWAQCIKEMDNHISEYMQSK